MLVLIHTRVSINKSTRGEAMGKRSCVSKLKRHTPVCVKVHIYVLRARKEKNKVTKLKS